jgi:hypothetical protein
MRAAAALLLAATMACRAGTQDSSRPAAATGSGSTASAGACGQDGDELRTRDAAGCLRQQRAACKERGKLQRVCWADASGRCNAMLVYMLARHGNVAGRSTDGAWACRLRGGGRIRADATLEQLSARARQRLEAASTTSLGPEAADDVAEGGLERYATRPPASLPARQCLWETAGR